MSAGSDRTEPPAECRIKKRILFSVGAVAAAVLLAAFLILGRPHRWQAPPLSREEAFRLQQIVGKAAEAMLTKDGKLAEEAELELTRPEINTLLNNALRAAQLGQTPELYYDAEWKDQALRLRVSRIFLFLAINLEAELVPSVRGGKVEVRARSCRIGNLPLPPSLVTAELQRLIRRYEQTPEFQVVPEIVRELTVQGDGIRFRLDPRKIALVFPLLLGTPARRQQP